jgi:hypothetical protein
LFEIGTEDCKLDLYISKCKYTEMQIKVRSSIGFY